MTDFQGKLEAAREVRRLFFDRGVKDSITDDDAGD